MIIPMSQDLGIGLLQTAAWCWVIRLLVMRMENPYDDDDFD